MKRCELTHAAAEDLDAIDDRTIEQFGLEQAIVTRMEFARCFERLAENPRSGHVREQLTPAGLTYRYTTVLRRFLVVHEETDASVRVIRVLDGKRDLRCVWDESDPPAE